MTKHRAAGKRQKSSWKPERALRQGLRETIAVWEEMPDAEVYTWFMTSGARACCVGKHPGNVVNQVQVGERLKNLYRGFDKFKKELLRVRAHAILEEQQQQVVAPNGFVHSPLTGKSTTPHSRGITHSPLTGKSHPLPTHGESLLSTASDCLSTGRR